MSSFELRIGLSLFVLIEMVWSNTFGRLYNWICSLLSWILRGVHPTRKDPSEWREGDSRLQDPEWRFDLSHCSSSYPFHSEESAESGLNECTWASSHGWEGVLDWGDRGHVLCLQTLLHPCSSLWRLSAQYPRVHLEDGAGTEPVFLYSSLGSSDFRYKERKKKNGIGLMLLAKSETKASEYSKLLQSCKAHKVYLCISDGRFEKNEVCPIEHEREV